MVETPKDETWEHPLISSVLNFEQFEREFIELSVIFVQYAKSIVSKSEQPRAIAVIPTSVIPSDLVGARELKHGGGSNVNIINILQKIAYLYRSISLRFLQAFPM